MLVDMNAFFASIEQLDHPAWRGRPLVVTNGDRGTCIITASYEARRYGIRTGMRLAKARSLCPSLVRAPSRPHRYAAVSKTIMEVLTSISPDQEIFSVDECFLDISHCRLLYASPLVAAKLAKQRVFEATGLTCSVGVSGDKCTAKFAAKQQKPDGLTLVPPWEAAARLAPVSVEELCGIGPRVGRFLARHGVVVCGDMRRVPISVLAKRFGHLGRRMWYMCQGKDPEPVRTAVPDPKSLGHGKVLPPGCDDEAVLSYLYRMSLKVGARLRRHGLASKQFFIGLRSDHWEWLGGHYYLPTPDHDGHAIYMLAKQCHRLYGGYGAVRQVQVTALNPLPTACQGDLFDQPDPRQEALNHSCDAVHARFGHGALQPASLLGQKAGPDVIAPAWRPTGVRRLQGSGK